MSAVIGPAGCLGPTDPSTSLSVFPLTFQLLSPQPRVKPDFVCLMILSITCHTQHQLSVFVTTPSGWCWFFEDNSKQTACQYYFISVTASITPTLGYNFCCHSLFLLILLHVSTLLSIILLTRVSVYTLAVTKGTLARMSKIVFILFLPWLKL